MENGIEESSLYPFKEEKMFELVKGWCREVPVGDDDYFTDRKEFVSHTNIGYRSIDETVGVYLKKHIYNITPEAKERYNMPNLLNLYNVCNYTSSIFFSGITTPDRDVYSDMYDRRISFWVAEFNQKIDSDLFYLMGLQTASFPTILIVQIKRQSSFTFLISEMYRDENEEIGKQYKSRVFSIKINSKERAELVSNVLAPMKGRVLSPKDKQSYLLNFFKCGKKVTTVSDIEETEEERKAINLRLARYAMKFWLNKTK